MGRYKTDIDVGDPRLKDWGGLCRWLMSCADRGRVANLLRLEEAGRARPVFVTRIKERLARLENDAMRVRMGLPVVKRKARLRS